jgi:hypothetical protein
MDAPAGPTGAGDDRSHDVARDGLAFRTGHAAGVVGGPRALDEARARGFVGGGQGLGALAEHARGSSTDRRGDRVLDLGSGGGVPGS